MFFSLILENANGDRVDMTATANQNMTSRVEGLNPPTRHNQHLRLSGLYHLPVYVADSIYDDMSV